VAETNLSEEERSKARDWLNNKSSYRICPSCSTEDNWELAPALVQIHAFSSTRNPGIYPAVLFGCRNCGLTVQVLADVIGIAVPAERKQPTRRAVGA
jgi:hypothetical protein